MKRRFFKIIGMAAIVSGSLIGCTKDLNRYPLNDVTSETVYANAAGYKMAMAKIYGGFSTTSSVGTDKSDIEGVDAGTSEFTRMFWYLQELVTDEALIFWTNDEGVPALRSYAWDSQNVLTKGLYYRILFTITLCNDFLSQCTDTKLAARGISGADATNIKRYRDEVRFIRAYQYWAGMDLYGNLPFSLEVSSTPPSQIKRADLFKFIESELKALESTSSNLAAPRTNEYGRVDKGAVWALFARMYLNSEVYTSEKKYDDAIVYAKKVIDAGYSLAGSYRNLFLADNHITGKSEFILTANYDGIKTQSYGASTILSHGCTNNSSVATDSLGVIGAWAGFKTTSKIVQLFPSALSNSPDKRASFTGGSNTTVSNYSDYANGGGVSIIKFRNLKSDGTKGSDNTGLYVDTDFPLFRLAEMYLIYAEAKLRGGNGDGTLALNYFNSLRRRAYQSNAGDVAILDLDLILDERARELHWEGHRRTDLIRFGKFTGGAYVWPWKGGVATGQSIDAYRALYPIPASDLNVNLNLKQNPGY